MPEATIVDSHCRVDAPDAFYSGVRSVLVGNLLRIFDSQGAEMGSYEFDSEPEILHSEIEHDRQIIGLSDGQPLVVVHDNQCKCKGTRKVLKNNV